MRRGNREEGRIPSLMAFWMISSKFPAAWRQNWPLWLWREHTIETETETETDRDSEREGEREKERETANENGRKIPKK